MPREKKESRILNIRLAEDVHDQLDRFSEETGISKTLATEKILRQYFKEFFKRPESERKLFQ